MTYDHLVEIKTIIDLLKIENQDEVAIKLQYILDYTFSGTELIMAIKFTLEQMPKNKVSSLTQKRIDVLISHIKKILS